MVSSCRPLKRIPYLQLVFPCAGVPVRELLSLLRSGGIFHLIPRLAPWAGFSGRYAAQVVQCASRGSICIPAQTQCRALIPPLRGRAWDQRTRSAFSAASVTRSSSTGPSWPRAETFSTASIWPVRTTNAESKLFTVGHTWRGRR